MTARNVIGVVLCAAFAVFAASHGTTGLLAQSGYTTTTVSTGSGPFDVAVNPATNKIYVSNLTNQNVSVISGTTDAVVATIATPFSANPEFIAVNPATNRIYVEYAGNFGGSLVEGVMMIDGATDTLVATFAVGHGSVAMSVDSTRNLIYVPNAASNSISVIDGALEAGFDLPTRTIPVPAGATHLAVNPVTNRIYATGGGTGDGANAKVLTVIDGTTFTTTQLPLSRGGDAVAVNPTTNKIYVVSSGFVNFFNGQLTVLDGDSNAMITLTIDGISFGPIAVNSTSNKVYISSSYSLDGTFGNTVTVIDGVSNATADITVGTFPQAIAVDPVTDKVYVANLEPAVNLDPASDVTVIEGRDNSVITTLPAGSVPLAVAVNPFSHKAYTADNNSNDVTVITPPLAGNTPTGTSVSVTPAAGLTVTFNQVTTAGDTTAVAVTSPPPPAGFQLDGLIYDVSTTATYVPAVTVCLAYSSGDLNPHLSHYENGQWVDRTVLVNTVNLIVCGQVTSLSPFAVLKPVAPPQFTAATPPLTTIQGAQYAYTFTASGLPAPSFALGLGAPSWLSVGTTSGLVSGTPPSGTNTFAYSVIATNGVAPDAIVGPFVVTVSAPAGKSADLSISINGPATATRGSTVTYTIVVTNSGPLPALDGTVAMVVGPGATLVSADPAPAVRTSGLWIWRFETLDARASTSFSVSVKLSKAGRVIGFGTVQSETRDKALTNNVAIVETAVK